MKKLILSMFAFALVAQGEVHDHSLCHDHSGWELAVSCGQGELIEKEDDHSVKGTIVHVHATKGLDYEIAGIPVGISVGAEKFLDSDIDHFGFHACLAFFINDRIIIATGPAIEYGKHAEEHGHHDDDDDEDEEDEEEHSSDWESEIGWHTEIAIHLFECGNLSYGLSAGYGANKVHEHIEYGIHIGKHF